MKIQSFTSFFCIAALLLASFAVKAQTDSFDADIMKMQQVNGSAATTQSLFPRIVAQLKPSNPNISEAQWTALKLEVFDAEVAALNEQLIPLFKKYFSQADVKAIIAFYVTPAGKKLAEKTPQMTMEQMQLSQTWGMGLMGKIKTFLEKPAKNDLPIGIKRLE